MSSILLAVFKTTIGLLVNKGRDKAAEKLKEGDVTDQNLRDLIVREMYDVKSKLDGLARKDLLAAIDYFEEGLVLLSDVVHSRSFRESIADVKAVSLDKRMKDIGLAGLDESATAVLSHSKERFKDARRKATEAFNDEGLTINDRVQAMEYRVMATILETVDNPSVGLAACRMCIERLHSLPAVQNCFTVELRKGLRSLFSKDERRKIISRVCQLNCVIYNIKQTVDDDINLWNWPCVCCGEEKVDPLRDSRLAKTLGELGMGDCCVTPRSFGQEGEKQHRLKNARGIATNTKAQFIVGDNADQNRGVKVFDRNGKFLKSFCLPTDDAYTTVSLYDVATDLLDNIYVLVRLMKPGTDNHVCMSVYVYDNNADLHHKFLLRDRSRDWFCFALTVNDKQKVMVVANRVVDMHEADGQFVRSFGQGILRDGWAITSANEGRVMVLDRDDSYVHVFSEQGEHLFEVKVKGSYSPRAITFHQESEHFIVIGQEQGTDGKVRVLIYTKEGDFLRNIQLEIDSPQSIAVTKEGRFSVVYKDWIYQNKVIVV